MNKLINQQDMSRQQSVPRTRGHSRTNTQFNTIDAHIVQEGGPGSGAGRFRMRSRTPNTNQVRTAQQTRAGSVQRRVAELQSNQGGYSFQGSSSIQQNDYDTITASNYGARSHRKFVKKVDRRRGHSKSTLIAPASTVASTLSQHYGVGKGYVTGSQFAKGPAYHI